MNSELEAFLRLGPIRPLKIIHPLAEIANLLSINDINICFPLFSLA